METNILTGLIARQASRYGERAALSAPDNEGKWHDISWNRLSDDVDKASAAMAALGICEADNIATFSANRPENIVTDYACFNNRAASVSIYATSSLEQLIYILNDAGCPLLFVGNTTQYKIARQAMQMCPNLRRIIVIKPIDIDTDDDSSMLWSDFMELGANASSEIRNLVKSRISSATPDDIATLVYTSGTTGEPKGAILPHSNYDAAMESHLRRIDMVSDKDVSMAFLPLCHIFEKGWTYFCLVKGIKVAVNRDPQDIQSTIQQVRPTCMCSVPRFWEKVYTAVQEKISSWTPAARVRDGRSLRSCRQRNDDYARTGKKTR